MAASRSSRVTRSSVGINGLDENFCGRTLRNRSIAQPGETSPPAVVTHHHRARSPKKRPEHGPHSGKVADGKAEAEPSSGTRKRGFSSSDKDEPEKPDGGASERERVRGGGGVVGQGNSPTPKRAKCCPRSGEPQGRDEDDEVEPSPKPESPEPAAAAVVASKDNDEDSKADAASAPEPVPSLGLDKEAEEKKDEVPNESLPPVPDGGESHKATNGLVAELGKEEEEDLEKPVSSHTDPRASPTALTNSSLLPNGSRATLATPDPIVPCESPPLEQVDAPDGLRTDGEGGCPATEASDAILSQQPEVEVEVDVDVVGDAGSQVQEEGATNGGSGDRALPEPQDPCDDCSNISGETAGLASSQLPTEPPSFTEPQEHRYALRTSPRRASTTNNVVTGITSSSPKPCSPHPDDCFLKDEEAEATPPDSDDVHSKEPLAIGTALDGDAGAEIEGELSECVEAEAETGGEVGASEGTVSGSTKEPSVGQADEEEEDEEPDVYYFESDHLALKHNKDYQRLLQTIGVLEAQRTQAILDLEALSRHQKEALANPISFVDQLQRRVELGLPCPQRVVQLPDIAWDQYTSGRSDFEREFCDKKRKTRRLKLIFDKVGLPARPKSPTEPKKESESSVLYSSLPSSDAPELAMSSAGAQMIRGRPYHQNKPDTFNQLWTVEEQKKLEQLLLKFPPEEVESKRWQKIADELGNRTAKQVASRVQKYFIKLTKAGIPVPGRTPNLCVYSKKASGKRQHHLNKHLYRPSTFLTSYEPPVYMDEEDERSSCFGGLQDATAGPHHDDDDSEEDDVPVELRHLPEFKELQELKRLRKRRIQEIHHESTLSQHVGYKCDACGVEPIQGVRWHCQDCPQDSAVDFCSSCSDCTLKTESHKPGHRLEPVCQAESFLDRDYCLPRGANYNYLDPNYFPANR